MAGRVREMEGKCVIDGTPACYQ